MSLVRVLLRWFGRRCNLRGMDTDHHKEVQLGYVPTEDDEDPEPLADAADLDAVWADATTVDEYRSDLRLLADVDPALVDALRADREAP